MHLTGSEQTFAPPWLYCNFPPVGCFRARDIAWQLTVDASSGLLLVITRSEVCVTRNTTQQGDRLHHVVLTSQLYCDGD